MPEGMHARRPHDEVQAGRKQRCNQQVNQEHRGVRRAGREHRHGHHHQTQHRCGHQVGLAGGAQRLFAHAHIAAGCLGFAQQPPGPPHQHHRHDQKVHHQGELGKRHRHTEHIHHTQPDAHGLDLGNQQGRQIRPGDRAHAPHHHHDKGRTDDVQVHLEVGGLAGQLQGTAQSGQQSTQRKHGGEQPGLVHAQRADHFAVLRGRTNQGAKTGAGEKQPQQRQHHRPRHDQKEVVHGKLPTQNGHRTRQARRAWPQQLFRAPQPKHRVFEHQHQGKCG